MITAGQRWLMIFLGILSLYMYAIEWRQRQTWQNWYSNLALLVDIYWVKLIVGVKLVLNSSRGFLRRVFKVAGIRYNRIYSVNCVRINCSSENITVLDSPHVFDEMILLRFFTWYIPFCYNPKKPRVDFSSNT